MDVETNFETAPCSRCGGNGRYSYTPRYGDTCFKCGGKPHVPGTGRMLTLAGRKAREAWIAANSETVTAGDLREGDRVHVGDGRKWTAVKVERGDFGFSSSVGAYGILITDRAGTGHAYPEGYEVVRWTGDFEGPPKAPANTDRRAEMRAYVKAAAAFVASRAGGN